jgi:hypothetical protein
LVTDGTHYSDYDPDVLDAVLGETAQLQRRLGFTAEHTIMIGGVVPSLLVLDPPGPRHLGTSDIDLCLSMALVEGDTAEYDRIETALVKAGFVPTDQTFRWRQATGLRLTVEFFCPAGEGRPQGHLFRPKRAENPTAKHNMGPKLSAIALEAGQAIVADTVTIDREVVLPGDTGRTTARFRVCGLAGFLAAKTSALKDRDKPKDAYDIIWIIENWPDGIEGAAQAICDSPAYAHPEVTASLAALAEEFSAPDRLGPRSYARFLASSESSRDERARLERQAAGAVRALGQALSHHP